VVAADVIGADRGIGALVLPTGNLLASNVVLSRRRLAVSWPIDRVERLSLYWR
jgi:hypothetical protein